MLILAVMLTLNCTKRTTLDGDLLAEGAIWVPVQATINVLPQLRAF